MLGNDAADSKDAAVFGPPHNFDIKGLVITKPKRSLASCDSEGMIRGDMNLHPQYQFVGGFHR